MEREIKFRAKTIKDNVWVYGSYHFSADKKHHYILILEKFISGDIAGVPGFEYLHDKEVHEVIHETVGQLTGLKDAKGKDIYERDIIHSDYSDGRPCRHIIKYDTVVAAFVAENLDGLDEYLKSKGIPSQGGICREWLTDFGKIVIGNEAENPELLK